MAATMKDLAKRTGLGLATISSYFNGGNVREKNRIKIEEAIRELHYEVNEVARGLKTNATMTVGVVIPELNNIFCAEVITGMEDILRSKGYATIVCDCRTNPDLEREALDFLTRKRVDGIICMPVDTTGAQLEGFRRTGKPIVLIDRKIQGLPCDHVLVDNERASRDAVELLIREGHRCIGIIGGPRGISTARERLAGYCEGLRENGISPQERLVYQGDYTIQGGVDAVEALVKRNPDMTAVFVANYEMTMGAVIGVNEMGLRIPEELSLIGFDNIPFARACSPTLTVVQQPTREIAQEAAELILERLLASGKDEKEPVIKKLQTQLFMGRSIGKL